MGNIKLLLQKGGVSVDMNELHATTVKANTHNDLFSSLSLHVTNGKSGPFLGVSPDILQQTHLTQQSQ